MLADVQKKALICTSKVAAHLKSQHTRDKLSWVVQTCLSGHLKHHQRRGNYSLLREMDFPPFPKAIAAVMEFRLYKLYCISLPLHA